MNICFLTEKLSSKDGWGSYSVGLIKEMRASGINCRVLSSVFSQKSDLPDVENYQVLPPLFVSRFIKIFYLVKNFRKIKKLLVWADLIHIIVEPYASIVYFTNWSKPLIVTFHGSHAVSHLKNWYLKKFYNRIYQQARKIICVSRFTQNETLKKMPLKNTMVINNGVDFNKFQRQGNQLSRKKEPTIISVGALVKRKGYHVAIKAAAKVKEKYHDLRYYIIGSQKDKNYFEQLKELVKQNNLENNVIFLQDIPFSELINLYYQSDLFLLPSIYTEDNKFEGFGLVYLEANACGLPVIGTYGCGAEEAIIDNYNGFLVPQNDINKTADAVLKILDDPELAEKMSGQSRVEAQKRDWSKIAQKYLQVYQAIGNL